MKTNLIVPRNTRLQTVWRVFNADGSVHWQVWTACPDPKADFNQMLGTHMLLKPDGSVDRVTIYPDGTEDGYPVMPKVGE